MHWLAALPMYNVTPALAADWRTLLAHVREHLADWLSARGDTLDIVDPDRDLTASGCAAMCCSRRPAAIRSCMR